MELPYKALAAATAGTALMSSRLPRSTGLAKDAKFDPEGLRNALQLRAEFEGDWGATPPPIERYFDPTYYNKALAGFQYLQASPQVCARILFVITMPIQEQAFCVRAHADRALKRTSPWPTRVRTGTFRESLREGDTG
jgi:hypothetical protein